jgi:hypothetical protein
MGVVLIVRTKASDDECQTARPGWIGWQVRGYPRRWGGTDGPARCRPRYRFEGERPSLGGCRALVGRTDRVELASHEQSGSALEHSLDAVRSTRAEATERRLKVRAATLSESEDTGTEYEMPWRTASRDAASSRTSERR